MVSEERGAVVSLGSWLSRSPEECNPRLGGSGTGAGPQSGRHAGASAGSRGVWCRACAGSCEDNESVVGIR